MSRWRSLPTEAAHPRTGRLDTLSSTAIVERMNEEDRRVVRAVGREQRRIARGAEWLAAAIRDRGRIVFVGAGTSGRLGVLEAAEIPPTFGTSPSVVRALVAGGRNAVFRAREGAEDDEADGARRLARLNVAAGDVVVGISASGVTPFVHGALAEARRLGARTIIVTCAPSPSTRRRADLVIAPVVGPEVLTGSTRLKAGTATKMVLNMLSTTAMVLAGKTYGNLMVDVRTGSAKLKDRARRIVSRITGLPPDRAGALLDQSRGNVKAAIVMEMTGASYRDALARLNAANGRIAAVLKGAPRSRRPARSNRSGRSARS
jgi:N-acetylmuramic acid 6-phosphate etherase